MAHADEDDDNGDSGDPGNADPNDPGDGPASGDGSESADGVQIDMISGERMDGLTSMEKIRLVLDGVHEGKIVILEEGLEPDEESKLIEVTMAEINPEEFSGIEIETYPGRQHSGGGLFDRFLGGGHETKLTVIGPANRLETLHKDESLISTLVTRQ